MLSNFNGLSDKDIFVQLLERDVVNLYNSVSSSNAILNIDAVKDKIFSYADIGIEYLSNILFGTDASMDANSASEMANFIAKDKIEEYRNKIIENRKQQQ